MCGGGGGGGDPAKYQREQDAARQKRIAQGKLQLDQIFGELEGKTRAANSPYLNTDRNTLADQLAAILGQAKTTNVPGQYKGGTMNFTPATSQTVLPAAAQAQLAKLGIPIQQNTQQIKGQTSIGGYRPTSTVQTPSYNLADYLKYYDTQKNNPANFTMVEDPNAVPIWAQQESAYMDYATPQLEDQFGDAKEQSAFALARQGQSSGSLAGDQYADLSRDFDIQKQGVAETARGYGNQARSDIASQKQSLLNMLNASADPGATATAARSQLDALRAQPAFSPLGPLFQNATAGLAAGVAGRQSKQAADRYNQITYGGDPDRSSGTVRR